MKALAVSNKAFMSTTCVPAASDLLQKLLARSMSAERVLRLSTVPPALDSG